jgi:PAS domain S-box-containing protein
MSFMPKAFPTSVALRASTFDLQSQYGEAGSRAYRGGLLATTVAGPEQRRLAVAIIALSAMAFIAAAPFARAPLIQIPAFIPAYEAALVIIDLITAVLLFGQFAQLRSAALLALAAGYLFDGLMIIPHALSFPGVISPTGWLGAGSQTTAWLYMFWHGGFAMFVMAYAGLKRRASRNDRPNMGRWAAVWVIATVIGVSLFLILLATQAHDLLPEIMAGNGYTPIMKFVVGMVSVLSLAALLVLISNRPYAVLDLWLIVVMIAWLADVALSAVVNAGRFDLGFYAGRLYGLLAASFVLAVILVETSWLYGRLAAATAQLEAGTRDLNARVRERTDELARTNRQLSAILDASPLGIFMLDPDGVVVLWTGSAERVFGYTEKEALGRFPPYLVEDHMAAFRANIVARAADDAPATGVVGTRRRRKDGALIDVSAHWARVNDEAGQMLGTMCAVADITERTKLESQLRQAQKMEAVGNLTGGMAHDFNNLLGIIIGNLDLLRDRQSGDADALELTGEALDAALRGADLTRRLLAFARRQPLQPERADVNELIAGIVKLLERTLGEQIQITLDLNPDTWPVVVDPAQLESALTNLATNARDAMHGGGQLIITTGNRSLDADYASQHAEVQPGDYALIEVSDTGTGMAPEVASHIFEPFYTTKEPGKGTGLGLSMVFGFIKQSGGHINVYSEVGIGTIFRLYLRRADAGADAAGAVLPAAPARGSGETVLAVEDNASLRRVVVRQLTELGYRVLEAEDVQTALRVLESEPVDLLFTDIVMPGGTSGYELARTALSGCPEIKIVLTSGFPEHKIAGDANAPNLRLLSKPYRRDELGRILRDVLDS